MPLQPPWIDSQKSARSWIYCAMALERALLRIRRHVCADHRLPPCMCACACMHTDTYAYLYTCMYTCVNTHTHSERERERERERRVHSTHTWARTSSSLPSEGSASCIRRFNFMSSYRQWSASSICSKLTNIFSLLPAHLVQTLNRHQPSTHINVHPHIHAYTDTY